MTDFGYSINTSSRMNLDDFDKESFDKLAEMEPDVRKCMACGSCTASCTAGKFHETSLRSAILALQNGQEGKAIDFLKGCMLCGKCTMVCPRGINTRHLILSILKVYGTK
ncbi:MAG: 4Fe-4S dicluster domain-containing protein [Bacteroidales bacterium]|jgi:heterodisulfide reductase subunit C|nr:4Fe-4S dicluster domain-containing protein [Bacteroidales bacterium]MCI1785541.1 4Fe-4S dicluster domain-containing protein [Bacteroidales bacterium]